VAKRGLKKRKKMTRVCFDGKVRGCKLYCDVIKTNGFFIIIVMKKIFMKLFANK